MKIRQLSVFLENKSGRLANVADALAEDGIRILALSLADTSEFGILRLITDDAQKAADVLKAHKFVCMINEVTAVEVDDKLSLAKLLHVVSTGGVNVEYLYAFSESQTGKVAFILRFDDAEKAVAALKNAGINVLANVDLIQY